MMASAFDHSVSFLMLLKICLVIATCIRTQPRPAGPGNQPDGQSTFLIVVVVVEVEVVVEVVAVVVVEVVVVVLVAVVVVVMVMFAVVVNVVVEVVIGVAVGVVGASVLHSWISAG